MSVLIRGMEMPTSCDKCWALDDYGDYPRCRITDEQRGYNFNVRGQKMTKCPLVPVPPHGRLIDADEFLKRAIGTKCFRGDYALMLEELVGESTTIIPASRGNEGEEHTMDEFMYGQEGNPNDGSM